MPTTTVDIEAIAEAGVVGAGAPGFPTHVKLSGKADAVVINAAECEPLLHKDKELLHAYGDEVLEGLQAAIRLVGAAEGWVGIKEKYHDVIDDLRPRLPGGVEIALLRDSYPAGDEFILVYDVLGRVIPPGGIPLHVGVVVLPEDHVVVRRRRQDWHQIARIGRSADGTVRSIENGVVWIEHR